jgi:hypothetical protein
VASTSSSILTRDRPYPTTSACLHLAACSSSTGALGGKAQHDLQATLRLTKISPAVKQFTIHTWGDLVEERRACMHALITWSPPASSMRASMAICRSSRRRGRMRRLRGVSSSASYCCGPDTNIRQLIGGRFLSRCMSRILVHIVDSEDGSAQRLTGRSGNIPRTAAHEA